MGGIQAAVDILAAVDIQAVDILEAGRDSGGWEHILGVDILVGNIPAAGGMAGYWVA